MKHPSHRSFKGSLLYLTAIDHEIFKPQSLTQRSHHFISFISGTKSQATVIDFCWPRFTEGEETSILKAITGRLKMMKGSIFRRSIIEKGAVTRIGIMPIYIPLLSHFLFELYIILAGLWVTLKFILIDKKRYNICIIDGPGYLFTGLFLKKMKRANFLIYNDQDYLPGLCKNRISRWTIGFMEKLCVRHSDLTITIGNNLAELRKKQGAKRVVVIPNGVDYELFAKAQRKIPHPPTIVYIGALESWAGVDLTIKAMPKIMEGIKDIRFLILGSGLYEEKLKRLAKELKLENILFLGRKKYAELPEYLSESDIGVAFFRPIKLMEYAFTQKVIEYMAAGLPVIGTNIGETERIIKESGAGEIVDFSEDEFADAVIKLLSSEEEYNLYAENAKKYSRDYDWKILFGRELDIIADLQEKREKHEP